MRLFVGLSYLESSRLRREANERKRKEERRKLPEECRILTCQHTCWDLIGSHLLAAHSNQVESNVEAENISWGGSFWKEKFLISKLRSISRFRKGFQFQTLILILILIPPIRISFFSPKQESILFGPIRFHPIRSKEKCKSGLKVSDALYIYHSQAVSQSRARCLHIVARLSILEQTLGQSSNEWLSSLVIQA